MELICGPPTFVHEQLHWPSKRTLALKSAKCCVFLGLNCVWVKSQYLGGYIKGGDLTHRDKYFNFPFLIKLIIGPGGVVVYKGVDVCTVKLKRKCEG